MNRQELIKRRKDLSKMIDDLNNARWKNADREKTFNYDEKIKEYKKEHNKISFMLRLDTASRKV